MAQLSKLTLRRRLRALGREDAFNNFLAVHPFIANEWNDAQCIDTEDPVFANVLPRMKQELDLSDADYSSLIQS